MTFSSMQANGDSQSFLSASWILSANSWMQTPAGVTVHDGQSTVVNWRQVLMNPSWPYRLPHMLTAACNFNGLMETLLAEELTVLKQMHTFLMNRGTYVAA